MLRCAFFTSQSEHRTLDITEADLLYVPVYVNMLVWPVYGWADGPWWHSVFGATAHLLLICVPCDGQQSELRHYRIDLRAAVPAAYVL